MSKGITNNPKELNNIIDSFNEGILNIFNSLHIKEENISLSKKFLQEAKTDIKSAKILYDQKIYSRSIYFLQQSVEKASKAWYIIFSKNPIKDIYNISHTSPKVFIKQLENNFNFLFDLHKIFSQLPTNTRPLKDVVENKVDELSNISEKKIKNLLKTLEDLDSYKEIIEGLIVYIVTLLNDSKTNTKRDLKNIESLPHIAISIVSLYLLSMLTFPHESTTRYPDKKMTPKDYNKKMGIVKCFNDLYRYTKEAINHLDVYLNLLTNRDK